MRLNRLLAMSLLASCAAALHAQDDVEYRAELGAGIGMTSYHGDFSSALIGNVQPAGAVVFRRIFNPRMALRIAAMYTKVKGKLEDVKTVYPDLAQSGYSFSNSIGDLTTAFEYNFLPYGTGRDYRGAKRLTPFVSLGIGVTYANCPEGTLDYSKGQWTADGTYTPEHNTTKGVFTMNIPIGFGVKYKVGSRSNIILDWQMHFSLSDRLDGIKDPYRIPSSGLFKNTDCYSTLMLSYTYSLSPKCSTCNNDR